MEKIILDTNALMAIAEFKLDVFEEIKKLNLNYELFVLAGTIEELEKIFDEQKGKFKRAVKLALAIIKTKKEQGEIKIIPSVGVVDDLLVEYSQKKYLILTQDVGLKKRLNKPYLTIRQKKKIVMIK